MHFFFDGSKRVIDAFKSEIFPIKIEGTSFSELATPDRVSDHSYLKILAPKKCFKE